MIDDFQFCGVTSIASSNRHIHLSLQVFEQLFNQEDLIIKTYLGLPPCFAANEKLKVKCLNSKKF